MFTWIIAFLATIGLIVYTLKKRISKKWLKIILVIIEVALAVYMLFRVLFPFIPMLKPSGKFAVKEDFVYYSHETKYPDMETEKGKREIPVHVYHPENMEKESHPLMVFSHGSFGVGSSNETLFYELASRGYIVMSLEHPHHSFFSKLSSGKTIFIDINFMKEVISSQGSKDLEKTLSDLNRWLDPRIEDINFVLDKVLDKKVDNEFEDKIDTMKIVLSGHSLGGSAVLAVGRLRPRDLKALVILEAPFVKEIKGIENNRFIFSDEEYPRPILHIYSDSLWGKLDTITTYEMNYRLLNMNSSKFVNKHIEGVGHIGLTDMSLVSPFITNRIDEGINKRDSHETLKEINSCVTEFLQKYN